MAVPDYAALVGAEVTNEFDEKLGKITGLFADDESNVPTWVAVVSGLFGRHHALVPLAEARWDDDRLLVPYTRDDLAIAPHNDPNTPLSATEEQALFAHYNVGYGDLEGPGPHTGVSADETGLTGVAGVGSHPVQPDEESIAAGLVPGVPGLPTTEQGTRLRRYDSSDR